MITTATSIAKPIAPEDLRIGDFVAQMQCAFEFPSFFWCGADIAAMQADTPIRIHFQTYAGDLPLKVKAICLPFLFVKTPEKSHEMLDVRRIELVRLDDDFSKTVWSTYAKKRKKSHKYKRKRKSRK